MSVIGPRPALPSEVKTYTPYQRQRLLMTGGLTCYWQTRRNRDTITFDEWIDLDLCDCDMRLALCLRISR
ncbi:MAG: sugar transferase [Eggerthellaceae bacterium]|nr:sugar transferase [Eggerthellaceae bacterium]